MEYFPLEDGSYNSNSMATSLVIELQKLCVSDSFTDTGTIQESRMRKYSDQTQSPTSVTSLRQECCELPDLRPLGRCGRSRSFCSLEVGSDDFELITTPHLDEENSERHTRSRSLVATSDFMLPQRKSFCKARRVHSYPGKSDSLPYEELKLRHKRALCETSIQQLYEERKDHIMELFEDSWIISDPLDDDISR